MNEFVTVEYRGIDGELPVGASVTVDSCDAGVLRLRLPPKSRMATSFVDPPKAPVVPSIPTAEPVKL